MLRGLLFAGIILALYRFVVTRLRDYDRAKLAVLILVLVPVFIDLTFRRLSATTLLCFAIVGTYFAIEIVLRKKGNQGFILFGVCMGIGLMSKYNHLFFAAPLLLGFLWDKDLRHALWSPKLIISIFVMLLIVSPHPFWLFAAKEYQAL